ncbi:MAG: sulfate reduction electron transfer complex DsrMKJOP subunit DsrM [Bryobacteraceae bacterium]
MRRTFGAVVAVLGIVLLAGVASRVNGLRPFIAIVCPYGALAILLIGLVWRVIRWSRSPVPFRIPTVCGQQKSLPWIKAGWLESPYSTPGVIARMGLEVLLFRSLFRNTRARLQEGPRLIQGEAKWLWLGAIAFHWSLLIVLLRHLRFLAEPVPNLARFLESVDGFFQIGVPVLYATDVVLLAALLYLVQRRLRDPQVRFISLFTDYFALFLLLGIAVSGVWMRYFARVDAVAVKQLAISLTIFSPSLPRNLSAWFFVHLALVSSLAAYLPFSKLMHVGGIFLSPTRNLANNNRMKRHVNPWNYPVKVHTYEEWEDEFREKIEAAGLPVERR